MNKSQKGRAGFTLVELLVATAATALLLLLLASLLQTAGGATGKTGGRMEAEREARAAFEMLERDLASTVRRKDGQWIQVIDDPDPPDSGGDTQWLMFLASPLDHDRSAAGDVCVLSYRLGHTPLPGEEDPFPSIHRLVAPAKVTYESALGRDNLERQFFSETEPLEIESRSMENWLATGVIDIQVRGWIAGSVMDLNSPSRGQRMSQLDALEVTLEVLTKRGQRLFGILTPAELRKRHAYRFTRVIPIPASSP